MPSVKVVPSNDVPVASSVLRPASSRLWIHLLLFALTLFSTTMVGMRYMYTFTLGQAPLTTPDDIFPFRWMLHNLSSFAAGLPFSLTLLGILLAHEFAHYFACRAYGVSSTLPYVLPAPTLSGTAGAVIRLRSRIRSRAALVVIGASGPIAGFAVALVTTCIGLNHSKLMVGQAIPPVIRFHAPLILTMLRALMHHANPAIPPLLLMVPHPMLVASWIGFLITALNLIPAGQLDGGHILYALSPTVHRTVTQIVIITLFFLGTVEWLGWILWAVILMLPGMRHPRITSGEPLKPWQMALVPVCILILLFSGTLQPFTDTSLAEIFGRIHWGLRF